MVLRRHLHSAAAVALVLTLLSCGSPGPPQPPSLEVPRPATDLRATRKGNDVTLTWTVPTHTTDEQTIRHMGPTLICRSLQVAINSCGIPVGQVAPSKLMPQRPRQSPKTPAGPVQITYTDKLPINLQEQHPTALITYAVETQNTNNRGAGLSNQVQVPLAPVLPPPTDVTANVTGDGVVLTWTSTVPEHEMSAIQHVYRVYRRETGANKDTVAGEIPLSTVPRVEFVDHSFEWQKTYEYRVCVVTVLTTRAGTSSQVEGDDSPPVKTVANDVFPPAVPSGLQAVASGVGQKPFIDLTWAPVTDADLAGYNVYRHEDGQESRKINADLVKTPAFRDETVQGGDKYFYSVSAVDLRGNESGRSEEASETLPNP